MKTTNFLLPAAFLAIAFSGFASLGWSDDSCGNGDRFNPAATMPRGPYRGKCLLNSVKRPAYRLAASEVLPLFPSEPTPSSVMDRDGFWIANVSSLGEFYLVKVPKQAPSRIIVHIEHFNTGIPNVPAAHVQFRIQYPQNLQFYRQFPQATAPTFESPDLVFSVEANSAEGQPWDILKTLIPETRLGRFATESEYVLAYRARSLADVVKTMITDQNNQVEQVELNFSPEEAAELVNVWLANSKETGSELPYHLLLRSCSTELFKNIDQVLAESRRTQRPDIRVRALNHMPWRAKEALRLRSLLSEERPPLPSLNAEMTH